jgi:YVTN family beta-propeller protein
LGERYSEALGEHNRILRETFAAHDGHEIDTQGDSFFVAFRRAKDAVAAVVEGQRRLAEHEWPDGADLRVRMGLHTGEPAAAGERYVGLGVHRAARISAAGHGGQVLVSQATRELLRDDPLPDVSLRDLGEHQLKDFDEPERLYQLLAPGLQETFPPLKTGGATPFEGREEELAEAAAEQMAAPWRHPGRRTLILATFGAAVVGVVAGVLLTQGGGSAASAALQPDSVGVINPSTGRLATTFTAGASPGGVAVGDGATWVTNTDAGTVSRINAGSNALNQTYTVGGGPVGVAVGDGSVWVANGSDGTVSRINPASPSVAQTIQVGNGPVGVAYGDHAVWVANSVDGTISVIRPGLPGTNGKVLHTFPAIPGATGIVVAFNRVWVVSPSTGRVVSLDPDSGRIEDRIPVGVDPAAIAAGDGAIWIANRDNGTVSKIVPGSPTQAYGGGVVSVGRGAISIAAVPGSVWVANGAAGTLTRIDPSHDRVTATVTVANPPQALAATNDGIYVAVGASDLEHRGGTLRVADSPPDSIDPALAYTPQAWGLLAMTNDGLVGFRRVGGIEGVQLVPDLAVDLPAPADGGTAYTFRLRRDVRYSNGQLVQPGDFRQGIERFLELQPPGAARQYFADIVGARRCGVGKPCDLAAGIVTDPSSRTVTFHLTKPDPDFLTKLAMPWADPVPAGTPEHLRGRPVPATGPYRIASYKANKYLRLVRNPEFRQWSVDAQPAGFPDKIDWSFNNAPTPAPAIRAVEQADADLASNLLPGLPRTELSTLAIRYPSRLHLSPGSDTAFFMLNTRVPPFNDVKTRQAVNEAFDRQHLAHLVGTGVAPTCQILPPDFPGYRKTCPPGAGGAVALKQARKLLTPNATKTAVTVWAPTIQTEDGRYMVSLLHSLGFRAQLKVIANISHYFSHINDSRTNTQVMWDGWYSDFPSEAGFLPPLFACSSFVPNSPNANVDPSEFCNPAVDRLMAHAETVQASNPAAAGSAWQTAEHAILQQAPAVPIYNQEQAAFASSHIHNLEFNPQWGVLYDQLWLK